MSPERKGQAFTLVSVEIEGFLVRRGQSHGHMVFNFQGKTIIRFGIGIALSMNLN